MKFKDIFGAFIIIVLAVLFYKITLVILGLILLFVLALSMNSYVSERRIKRFRKEYEGKYFLWYSSRKEFKTVIETDLKPLFNLEYYLVYNSRSKIESNLTEEQIRYLRNESEKLKLPLMMRIGKDKVHAESFYQEINHYKYNKIDKVEFKRIITNKLNKLNNIS